MVRFIVVVLILAAGVKAGGAVLELTQAREAARVAILKQAAE